LEVKQDGDVFVVAGPGPMWVLRGKAQQCAHGRRVTGKTLLLREIQIATAPLTTFAPHSATSMVGYFRTRVIPTLVPAMGINTSVFRRKKIRRLGNARTTDQ